MKRNENPLWEEKPSGWGKVSSAHLLLLCAGSATRSLPQSWVRRCARRIGISHHSRSRLEYSSRALRGSRPSADSASSRHSTRSAESSPLAGRSAWRGRPECLPPPSDVSPYGPAELQTGSPTCSECPFRFRYVPWRPPSVRIVPVNVKSYRKESYPTTKNLCQI